MAPRKGSLNGVNFIDCKALPVERDVEGWIERCELFLPEDYKRFLLRVNGGRTRPSSYRYPRWTSNTTWGTPQMVETQWMIPKPTRDQLNLLEALAEVKAYTRTPPKVRTFCYFARGDYSIEALLSDRKVTRSPDSSSLLPIACNDSNQPIWMSLSERYFGAVFHFDAGLDPNKNKERHAGLDDFMDLKIANSFSEFVRGLYKGVTMMKPGFSPSVHHLRVMSNRSGGVSMSGTPSEGTSG